MDAPRNLEEWSKMLRARFERNNRELGIRADTPIEVFTVTAWGEVPDYDQIMADFPNVLHEASNLALLKQRLAWWKQV